jgi:aminoglycoside phosphotransferase (APT) family kinase protein
MACVGAPEVDLTWFWFLTWFLTDGLGIPNLPGFPDRAGTAAIYEEFAKRPLRNLDYFEVWAAFRFGVVMVSIDEVVRQNGVDMPSASMLALSALERTRERCHA